MCLKRICSWNAQAIANVIAVIALVLSFWAFRATLSQSEKSVNIATVNSLLTEWHTEPLYAETEAAILGGNAQVDVARDEYITDFPASQLNRYLSWFETVGLYRAEGVIDFDTVEALLGSRILTAYDSSAIRFFVCLLRTNEGNPTAYEHFQRLAEEVLKQRNEAKSLRSTAAYWATC